ncbi:16S rRNA (guanine(527)-N(7))-methyltransferase RsmG [Methyloglobulus sp.]|uniref:16S rRNA (guanine(527)-N(7))-methyltransferase RsmG n=1 Tax=Methyloglobulus sp. TaxID=2518622 RepID=UPI003988CC54
MEACRDILVDGIAALNLSVDEEKIGQLLCFISLIEKWNKAYNLTAIKDKQDMVRLHLLDSLTVIPYLEGRRIIDIGTGAGLPGIPLAICLPHIAFTLLDSNAKKTRFVQQVVLELKSSNMQVFHSRVEDYQPEQRFSTVLTRAFAELSEIVDSTQHLLATNGRFLAMKGRCAESELAQVKAKKTVIPVLVPGVETERNLVCIQLNKENVGEKKVSEWEK